MKKDVVNSNDPVERAIACFKEARTNVMEGGALLYQIAAKKLWEAEYGSFSEFVEQGCGISKSFAAKLLKVYDYYLQQNKMPQARIAAVDAEKLYLALRLPFPTAEEKLLRAETWSRQDLKAELARDTDGEECAHPNPITICGTCNARL